MGIALFDESPLIIDRVLAQKVGLNEAIIIQQLHYWTVNNKKKGNNFRDGYYWSYNTYEDWQKQFPFWSSRTIRRIITKLEKEGYIVSANYNKLKIDKTKWYRLNYDKIYENEKPCGQNGHSERTNCPHGKTNMSPPLPETTTENNTKITTEKEDFNLRKKQKPVFRHLDMIKECAAYYGKKYLQLTNKRHRVTTEEENIALGRNIDNFIEEYNVDMDTLMKMVDAHFENNSESCWDFKYFAQRANMKDCLLDLFGMSA